jgi:hypothetical protein
MREQQSSLHDFAAALSFAFHLEFVEHELDERLRVLQA